MNTCWFVSKNIQKERRFIYFILFFSISNVNEAQRVQAAFSPDSHDSNVKAKYSTMQISVVSHTIVCTCNSNVYSYLYLEYGLQDIEREWKKAHWGRERQCFLNITRHYQPFVYIYIGKNHLFLFMYRSS